MKPQKLSYSTGSLALLLAVIGIVFIANFFSDRVFTRFDLTQNRQYTLSPSTRQMLAGLKDAVVIRGAFSSNIPSPWNQFIREVQDLLREYEAFGKGKIKLELVDPLGDPAEQEELGKLGINPVVLPVQGLDQASSIKAYASIYLQYLDKNDIIPYAFTTETLEYDLTSAINRLASDKTTKIGILVVDEGRKMDEEFGKLKATLAKVAEVEEVNFQDGSPVPADINVLLVLSPFRMSERDLYELDQYIMRGGQTIVLTDGARVFLQPGQFGAPMPIYAMPMNEQMDALGGLLAHYGVRREYNLVMDKPSQEYPILGPIGRPYPLFPLIRVRGSKMEGHPLMQSADDLLFTWASSLTLEPTTPGVKATPLVVTSPGSWIQAGNQLMVDPMTEPVPPLPVPGMGPEERVLAALLSGKFKSYFAGKPVPAPEGGDTAAPPPQPSDRRDESSETNILVIGTSTFVSNLVPVNIGPNLNFIAGAAEWMAGGQKLADIRKRKMDPRPLGELTLPKVVIAGFIAPLAAPLGVIVFGVVRFALRRNRKNKFLEQRNK
jgi:gliding-associated putative ABC transporter substrate-binding component GldG